MHKKNICFSTIFFIKISKDNIVTYIWSNIIYHKTGHWIIYCNIFVHKFGKMHFYHSTYIIWYLRNRCARKEKSLLFDLLRHLDISRAVTNRIFLSECSFMRAHIFCVTIQYKYHDFYRANNCFYSTGRLLSLLGGLAGVLNKIFFFF